jgi:hypothetical protein
MADENEVTDAEDKDFDVAPRQPAIFVDAFLVEAGEHIWRFTFGEGTVNVPERIRVALAMPSGDVKDLVKIITGLMEERDSEQKGQKSEPPK